MHGCKKQRLVVGEDRVEQRWKDPYSASSLIAIYQTNRSR